MSDKLIEQLMQQQKELLQSQQQLLKSQTDWAQTLLHVVQFEIDQRKQKKVPLMRLVK